MSASKSSSLRSESTPKTSRKNKDATENKPKKLRKSDACSKSMENLDRVKKKNSSGNEAEEEDSSQSKKYKKLSSSSNLHDIKNASSTSNEIPKTTKKGYNIKDSSASVSESSITFNNNLNKSIRKDEDANEEGNENAAAAKVKTFSRLAELERRDSEVRMLEDLLVVQMCEVRKKWRNSKEQGLGADDYKFKITGNEKEVFGCTKCSNALFVANEIVPHVDNKSCTMVMTIPKSWMGNLAKRTDAINCPTCGCCLGHYNWEGGACVCGEKFPWPIFVLINRTFKSLTNPQTNDSKETSDKQSNDKQSNTDSDKDTKRPRSSSMPGKSPAPLRKNRVSGFFNDMLKNAGTESGGSKGGDKKKMSRETIYANCFDDLPQDVQQLIIKNKISKEDADAHFYEMRMALRFQTKRHVRRKSQENTPIEEEVFECPELPVTEEQKKVDFSIEIKDPTYIEKMTEKYISGDKAKDYYKIQERAGRGGFGRVFVAKDLGKEKRNPERKCAVKKLPHSTPKEMKTNLREVQILAQLNHPNIVSYFRSHVEANELWMMMEYMEGGTLHEAAECHKFTESQIAYIAKECLKSLKYLHSLRLVHRDIKPGNIMLTTSGVVKLIDFGLCEEEKVTRTRPRTVGSPFWMAPEIILKKPGDGKIDIYSLGVTILELANGKTPFRNSGLQCIFMYAVEGVKSLFDHPNQWSKEFANFLGKLLTKDAEDRLTASDALKHPWYS